MESFQWNDSFVTGLANVDSQHRHLVDTINRFGDLVAKDQLDISATETVFGELTAYALSHFSTEETLMAQNNLDTRTIATHVAEHKKFLQDVMSMRSELSEQTPLVAKYLLDFLTHWLAYHILGTDQVMARQIDAIRSGQSPAMAFETVNQERDSATQALLVAVNNLFQMVSTRNRELVQLNQSLETMVAERTRALSMANQHLEELALTDTLTGLPNRRHALRQLASHWDEATNNNTSIVCMMVDADHFKQINDTHGHDAGDYVLEELSKTLRHAVRSDDIVCRLGGDEFLIICPATDIAGGLYIAELTRQKVAQLKVPAGDNFWHGSVSIGVAVRTPAMQTYQDLIKAADDSVYLAKEAGKNCVRSVTEQTKQDPRE